MGSALEATTNAIENNPEENIYIPTPEADSPEAIARGMPMYLRKPSPSTAEDIFAVALMMLQFNPITPSERTSQVSVPRAILRSGNMDDICSIMLVQRHKLSGHLCGLKWLQQP